MNSMLQQQKVSSVENVRRQQQKMSDATKTITKKVNTKYNIKRK